MREIKFRAWSSVYKKFLGCDSSQLSNYLDGYQNPIDRQYDHKTITPQQYTGLKDSKGNEIYEGDILKYDVGLGPIYYEVIWDEKNGLWMITKNNGGNVGSWFDNYEIAGNLFENPELLK